MLLHYQSSPFPSGKPTYILRFGWYRGQKQPYSIIMIKGTKEKPHSGNVVRVNRALGLGTTILPPKALYFGDFMASASLVN